MPSSPFRLPIQSRAALRRAVALAALPALSLALPAFSQTMPSTSAATEPATPLITIAPATEPTPAVTRAIPATAPAPATPSAETVTQAFVATITADKVYVRSGPGTPYYEMGQLGKGDLVYVVGSSRGWYQILPPNGTYCMVAKEFVDADGKDGTVKGDYVNIRAGTAINKNRDPSAVLTVVRKGTKLKIIGSTDKYYEVAPPERALVYISPQFVKAAPGTEYKVPELKLPPGATAPSMTTVEPPTAPPIATGGGTIVIPPEPGTGGVPTPGPITGGAPVPAPGNTVAPAPVEPPKPVVFSDAATTKFNDTNAKYQEESKKPPADQSVESLLKDFKDILAMENISPSVKAGSEANIAAIERTMTVQRLMKEQAAANEATNKQSEALRQQFDEAEKAIAAAREAGPYSAEGVLQSSTIVKGKYALVNPQTGRVVAYVDPAAASVDIGSLVGKYIGVRGITKKMEGSDIAVIQVSNATLMPQPK